MPECMRLGCDAYVKASDTQNAAGASCEDCKGVPQLTEVPPKADRGDPVVVARTDAPEPEHPEVFPAAQVADEQEQRPAETAATSESSWSWDSWGNRSWDWSSWHHWRWQSRQDAWDWNWSKAGKDWGASSYEKSD
eukprot:symbB.v1.2.007312.t1/scaffold447.1/size204395/9